jgi:hypothetical protein
MINALLFDKTPADVRLDGPIESVVHIPLNHARAVLRLLSFVAMAGGSIFALVTVALHFNDPTFMTKIPSLGDALDSTMIALRILQLMSAVGTLAFGVLGALRVIALLQSHQAGLSVGPRGITLAYELRHPGGLLIPWSSIAKIELRSPRGNPSIVLRLRPPRNADGNYSRFAFWPGARETIPVRSLRVAHGDLKMLIDRYFAHYGNQPSSSSKEAS